MREEFAYSLDRKARVVKGDTTWTRDPIAVIEELRMPSGTWHIANLCPDMTDDELLDSCAFYGALAHKNHRSHGYE